MSYVTTIEFLQALYPDPLRPGRLMVWTRSRKSGQQRSHWLHTLGQAATEAHRRRGSRESFFSVPLHDVDLAVKLTRQRWPRIGEPSARGGDDSAVALPALWAEIDVAAGLAGRQTAGRFEARELAPDRDAVFKLLAVIGVPPSIIVDVVSGYQVYWRLADLLLLETAEDRAAAVDALWRLQGALHTAAQAMGWWVDYDADRGRLMRLPDTFNLDWPGGRWIGVEHLPRVKTPGAGAAGDHRYDLTDFSHLPAPPRETVRDRLLRGTAAPEQPRLGDLAPIVDGCPWLAHWLENARRLQGKEYAAAVGIAGRCALGELDNRGVIHRFSKEHPGYNPVKTEEKLALALLEDAPTCQRIRHLDGGALCRGCVHFGRIEMPLDLGRPGADGAAVVECRQADPSAGEGDPDAAGEGDDDHDDPVPIVVTTREHEVNDRTMAALAARAGDLFTSGGVLIEVVRPSEGSAIAGLPQHASRLRRSPGSPIVRPLAEPRMRELLSRHCTFQGPGQPSSGGGPPESAPKPLRPPRWVVRNLLGRGSWPELPALGGIVECPVLRPGGSVLQRPGYDPESGLLYAPSGSFLEVPEAPGEGDALDALTQLREVVRDFPFATEAHRAAWLCSLLTPLARAAFAGPSPLNLIDANVRGCGKSLLADVCAVLLSGRPAARMSVPGREAELRRLITALALEAERMVLLDNVTGVLGSATLDRALTAEVWRDRVLGTSRQVALPLAITWYATGNNVALAGDTARRCLHIRLQSSLARPEKRADFRHPRLLEWLGRERRRLLPAAVTLLRAYVVAGRPRQPLEAWGSYEGWSDLVRSTVVWLGLPDPAATREALDGGGEAAVLHDLVFGLAELLDRLGRPATVKQILRELAGDSVMPAPLRADAYPRLRSALAVLFPHLERDRLPSSHQLAGRLRAYRGHVARGHCIDRIPNHHGAARWTVRKLGGH